MVVKVIMGEPEQLQLEVEGPSLEGGAAAAGLQPEVIPPPSFAKSQYGEPPTASNPWTRDQPEKAANSIQPPPCGNSASTGRSSFPPIRQTTRGLTNDKQQTPH